MYSALSIFTLLLSCFLLIQLLKPASWVEKLLVSYLVSAAIILVWGYTSSALSRLSDIRVWSLLGLATVIFISLVARSKRNILGRPCVPNKQQIIHKLSLINTWYRSAFTTMEKLIITPMVMTAIFLGITNFLVIIFCAPHNWDSMTYHLARVAYYLQQNTIKFYDANYWAQVIHPKNSSLLYLYTYLVMGRNENLLQMVQYLSYWTAVLSVYGISRKVGYDRNQSIFSAAVSALLIEWLMQATTTQNDMILTAYFGSVVYFLFAFRETRKTSYLGLSALGIGLSIGTKSSSLLPLASVALVAIYSISQTKTSNRLRLRNYVIFAGFTLLAAISFAFVSGYLENFVRFGNPIGPDYVREEHAFEGETGAYILLNGSRNIVRYGFEFLSLDGMPPFKAVRLSQILIKLPLELIVQGSILDPTSLEASRAPFDMHKNTIAHEDISYWGILGFGLVWITVILAMIGVIKSTDIRILAFAAFIFLIFQSYSGPYDPWRGRYFTICAVFAVPTVGIALKVRNRYVRLYLMLVVLIGCISALSAVILRNNREIISLNYDGIMTTSVFKLDRIEQLTRNRIALLEPLKVFDQSVPKNATVAVFLDGDSYEYPLFGEKLTRKIVPLNSFENGFIPIPPDADYLLYSKKGFPCRKEGDRAIGNDLFIRKLIASNRLCP